MADLPLSPDNVKLAIERGRYDEAIPALRKITANEPRNAQALFWLGLATYLTGGDVDDAQCLFDRSGACGHDAAQVAVYRGILYAETGRLDQAVADFETAVRLDPANSAAADCLSRALRNKDGRAAASDLYYPPPHLSHLDAAWLEECSVPQSQQFMIDCLPVLRTLLDQTPGTDLKVLDVGTASGAGAGVLGSLYRGTLFGKRLQVDAIDLIRRYQAFASRAFPQVNYICGDLFQVDPDKRWDVTICSHTIEHIIDPTPLIRHCQQRARSFALFYAPFEEIKLIPGHLRSIGRDYVQSLEPRFWEVLTSPGWVHPEDAQSRTVLFVLKGTG